MMYSKLRPPGIITAVEVRRVRTSSFSTALRCDLMMFVPLRWVFGRYSLIPHYDHAMVQDPCIATRNPKRPSGGNRLPKNCAGKRSTFFFSLSSPGGGWVLMASTLSPNTSHDTTLERYMASPSPVRPQRSLSPSPDKGQFCSPSRARIPRHFHRKILVPLVYLRDSIKCS